MVADRSVGYPPFADRETGGKRRRVMATAVLFMGWNRPVVGREGDAWKFLMGEGQAMLANFQKQGFFERIERVALTPHGGSVNGFLLLFGERAKLDELRRTASSNASRSSSGCCSVCVTRSALTLCSS